MVAAAVICGQKRTLFGRGFSPAYEARTPPPFAISIAAPEHAKFRYVTELCGSEFSRANAAIA